MSNRHQIRSRISLHLQRKKKLMLAERIQQGLEPYPFQLMADLVQQELAHDLVEEALELDHLQHVRSHSLMLALSARGRGSSR
jgi:hypothetical protein